MTILGLTKLGAVILPAMISGVFVTTSDHRSVDVERAQMEVSTPVNHVKVIVSNAEVARRLRIERIMTTLGHVAEASMQMQPERAADLEPVLIDLAEQALVLTSDEALSSSSTDAKLSTIEDSLDKLVVALSRFIEPEMSL